MKIALIKTKLRAKPSPNIRQQPTATTIQRNRKPQKGTVEKKYKVYIGTHLTVSGVCTTVRPEKSRT
jgi:hypothetical protein